MAIKVHLRGRDVLRAPLLNKGTAFSVEERDALEIHGLLPDRIETIEEQCARCYEAYKSVSIPLQKHIQLRALQDRNEVLFYRLVLDHLVEMMPIIYTPVVGEACQLFDHIYRQPRGLFIRYSAREKIDTILATEAAKNTIRVIVVTDGERILGLGDQGSGGLGIPIGKLSLYTICGGIAPQNTLPIILDVGTNNASKLEDPEYLGWRHARITGKDYDDFLDEFVQGIKRHFPDALLQFEDFAQQHAYPLLERYHSQLCTFNDDIQGTAAVAVAAVLAAAKVSQTPLKDQRIAFLGAGSAGCGIAEQLVNAMVSQGLSEAHARARIYMIDRNGLLHDGLSNLLTFQQPLKQSQQLLKDWTLEKAGIISLADVIQNAKPTALLGVSGQPQQFTEPMIRAMASYCDRPIIFPLSNPTARAEALPEDLLNWTKGQALIATGSPFDAVMFEGRPIEIAQCNNAYIFPGVGLGVVAGHVKRVTDSMMMAAAIALSKLAPAIQTGEGRLLPDLTTIRDVSQHIAKAVILEAIREGHMQAMRDEEIDKTIQKTMWIPNYEPYQI